MSKLETRQRTWTPEDGNSRAPDRLLELTDPDELDVRKRSAEEAKIKEEESDRKEEKRQQIARDLAYKRSTEEYKVLNNLIPSPHSQKRAEEKRAEEKRGEEAAAAPRDEYQDAVGVPMSSSIGHRALGLTQPPFKTSPGGKRNKSRRRRKSRRKSKRKSRRV